MRLSPNSPQNAMIVESIGSCHLYAGRYAEAVDWLRQAQAEGAAYDHALINLIVAEAFLERMEEAHASLERLLRIRPGATIRGLMERLPPGARGGGRPWPEGLRLVGLPEA